MNNRKFLSAMLLTLCLLTSVGSVQAQDSNTPQTGTKQAETKENDTNIETQLYHPARALQPRSSGAIVSPASDSWVQ